MNPINRYEEGKLGQEDNATDNFNAVTKKFSLALCSTQFFNRLWNKGSEEGDELTFVERCQILCQGTRFRKGVFRNLPEEIQTWPEWKEFCNHFRDHLPEFHSILEYVVRRIFRALFKKDSNVIFQWFIDCCATRLKLTRALIEATNRCKRGSAEKKVLQAVLHSSFTRQELQSIVKEHPTLFEGYCLDRSSEEKQGMCTDSCEGGTAAEKLCLGSRGSVIDEKSDDDIIDVPESDASEEEEEPRQGEAVQDSDDAVGQLLPEIYERRDEARTGRGNADVCGDSRHMECPFRIYAIANVRRRLDMEEFCEECGDVEQEEALNGTEFAVHSGTANDINAVKEFDGNSRYDESTYE